MSPKIALKDKYSSTPEVFNILSSSNIESNSQAPSRNSEELKNQILDEI